MLLFRYLTADVLRHQLLILLVLLLIFVSNKFVRYLAQAAAGDLPADVVVSFLLYYLPYLIYLLLPLSLFLGVLLTLGKLYADQEMTAMQACGLGLGRLLLYLMPVTLVLVLLAAWTSTHLTAMGLAREQQLKEAIRNRPALLQVEPGKFQQVGNFMVYATAGHKDELEGLFVVNQQALAEGRQEITLAQRALRLFPPEWEGAEYMEFQNGFQYQGEQGRQDYRLTRFGRYGVELKSATLLSSRLKNEAKPFALLWQGNDPAHVAERQWRLSAPVQALVAVLLAVGIGRVAPRQGKFAKFLPGISLYLLYFAVLSSARNLVEEGRWSAWPGLWGVHLVALLLALMLLIRLNGGLRRYR